MSGPIFLAHQTMRLLVLATYTFSSGLYLLAFLRTSLTSSCILAPPTISPSSGTYINIQHQPLLDTRWIPGGHPLSWAIEGVCIHMQCVQPARHLQTGFDIQVGK